MTEVPSPANPVSSPSHHRFVAVAGFGLFAAGLVALAIGVSPRQALLFLIGGLLGLALYHASFGFTSSYRVLFANGRSAGIRAQMMMLALACILFFPTLAGGSLFGQSVHGFVAPAGTSVAVGAFIFGIGMQLGGACASGTLFTAGGGNARMAVTLVFFIAGSVWGLEHLQWWHSLPAPPAVSVINLFGWPAALAANILVFAAVWYSVSRIEKRNYGKLEPLSLAGVPPKDAGPKPTTRLFSGPWPIIAGAIALAVLNFVTLYLAGRPWGITSAFPLWGAKIMHLTGFELTDWQSWSSDNQRNMLKNSIFTDITSIMNFGIMLGAMTAAALARRFRPSLNIPIGQLAASVIGGLLLGYGARLAYGCNIGAFFGGLVSGSLHGWLWIFCALAGNWIGMHLRPLFGMAVEWRKSSC